jgi:hypothetical protein
MVETSEPLVTSYFNWEGEPAVISPVDSDPSVCRTSFMRDGDKDWREGDALLAVELFFKAERLSKADFEEYFGVIGEALPALPKT